MAVKAHIYTFLLCLLPLLGYSQKLSPEAQKVKYAYDELMKVPSAAIMQIRFIQAFPGNKVDFINVFNSHKQDELAANGIEYIKKFRKLGFDFTDSVLPKSTTWSKGPVDELQKTIYYLTDKHPQIFVNTAKELKKEEQTVLANFLYAGTNGKNINYDILISIIENAGEKKLLKIFKEAGPTE